MGYSLSQNKSLGIKALVIAIIGLGIAVLIASTHFISSFLAIAGFSLVFWGAILLYIIPTKINQLAIFLHASAEVASGNIEQMLLKNGSEKQGIYIPAKWNTASQNNEDSISVFVPAASYDQDQLNEKQIPNLLGVYIKPPGAGLCKILEGQVGNSFFNLNIQKFMEILPSLLTQITGFAEFVNVRFNQNTLMVEITKSIFEATCLETDKQPRTHKQVGCLMSSALACALVKVTGKPVVILSEIRNLQGKTTKIDYKVMDELKD
jgi:hypothetical protein